MKKGVMICLVVLLTTSEIWAQNSIDKQLLGAWKLTKPTKELNEVYSFYTNNIYQINSSFHYADTIPYFKFDTSLVEVGIWKMKKNNFIKFTKRHTLPDTYGLLWWDLNYSFTLSNSNLSLTFEDVFLLRSKKKITSNYTHTTLLPQQESTDNYDFKQYDKNCLYLVNSLDATTRVKLDDRFGVKLSFEETQPNDSIKKRRTYLSGLVSYHTDTTIKCMVEKQEITTTSRMNYSKSKSIISKELSLGTVKIKDINSIEYHSRQRNSWHNVGFFTGFLSVLTIIVSPLVSIDYKNGKFNNQTFLTCAGSGLVGLSVGITISHFNNSKTYKLGAKNQQDKNIWYLDKSNEQR